MVRTSIIGAHYSHQLRLSSDTIMVDFLLSFLILEKKMQFENLLALIEQLCVKTRTRSHHSLGEYVGHLN